MTGALTLACAQVAGRSRLMTIRGEGLMRASRPLPDERGAVRVVTATLGPGLLGGDFVRRDVDVATNATLIVAAQMATPISAGDRPSRSESCARVAPGAELYVPGEVLLPAARSVHETTTEIDVCAGGFALHAEIVALGAGARLSTRTACRIDGRLVARDACDLEGDGSERALLTAIVVTANDLRLGAVATAFEAELAQAPLVRAGLGGTGSSVVIRARAAGVWPLQRLVERMLAAARLTDSPGTAERRVGAILAL